MPPKKCKNTFSFPQEKKMHVAPNDDDAVGKIEGPSLKMFVERKSNDFARTRQCGSLEIAF